MGGFCVISKKRGGNRFLPDTRGWVLSNWSELIPALGVADADRMLLLGNRGLPDTRGWALRISLD